MRHTRHVLPIAMMAWGTFFAPSDGQADVVIDTFDVLLNVNISQGGNNPFGISAGNQPAGVLGGSRGVTFTRTSGNGAASLHIDLSDSGVLEFASERSDMVTAFLQWDGDTNPNSLNAMGLGSVDLTEGGLNTQFVVAQHASWPNSPLTPALLTMTVYSSAGMASVSIDAVNTPLFSDPFVELVLPFTAFAGVNFTTVRAIELFVSGETTPGLAIELDYVVARGQTVAEPGSLALLGLGLAGLGFLRRKQ